MAIPTAQTRKLKPRDHSQPLSWFVANIVAPNQGVFNHIAERTFLLLFLELIEALWDEI